MMGVFAFSVWLPTQVFADDTVNIYSHRQQLLTQPFLEALTWVTGIETKIANAAKGLAQQLQAKGGQAQLIVDRFGC